MPPPKPRRRKPHLLSSTRPPHSYSSTPSSRATRTLIRTHHTLQKRLSTALLSQNTALATSLQSQLEASGGLSKYQKASLAGQSLERGGDSSRVLAGWVQETLLLPLKNPEGTVRSERSKEWRILDVGALRTDNAIARTRRFSIEHIDLHSQHPDIHAQDFMQRPFPATSADAFDVVSLSLVLNYVGDAVARGEMLRRVKRFLRPSPPPPSPPSTEKLQSPSPFFPGLFLVLPLPCVENSRYLNEDRLEALMRVLGYKRVRRKVTRKLVYSFWRLVGVNGGQEEEGNVEGGDWMEGDVSFRKEEVRKGAGRNNFAIVLV